MPTAPFEHIELKIMEAGFDRVDNSWNRFITFFSLLPNLLRSQRTSSDLSAKPAVEFETGEAVLYSIFFYFRCSLRRNFRTLLDTF